MDLGTLGPSDVCAQKRLPRPTLPPRETLELEQRCDWRDGQGPGPSWRSERLRSSSFCSLIENPRTISTDGMAQKVVKNKPLVQTQKLSLLDPFFGYKCSCEKRRVCARPKEAWPAALDGFSDFVRQKFVSGSATAVSEDIRHTAYGVVVGMPDMKGRNHPSHARC